MKLFYITVALLGCIFCAVAQDSPMDKHPGALMDFDFSDAGGKKSLPDHTGNYTLFSDHVSMLGEKGALRVADGAKLRIPCKDNAFGEKVTIEMWFLITETWDEYFLPLLERGIQYNTAYFVQPYENHTGQYDFTLYFCANNLPGFVTGNTSTDKAGTEGLIAYGNAYVKSCYYYNKYIPDNPAVIYNDPKKVFRKNHWQHIAAVYDFGSVTIYLNGIKIASSKQMRTKSLLGCGKDIYIGSFNAGEALNKKTAEMLVKSLCITGKVLSEKEIADRFNKEKSLLNADRRIPENLQPTKHYWSEEQLAADPDMQRELKIVTQYKKNLPADPYKGNQRMTGKIGEDSIIIINGQKQPPVLVRSGAGDRDARRRSIIVSDFAAAGLESISFDIRNFWLDENKYDWGELDNFLKIYVENCPTNKIAPQINLTPPDWFRKKYPEEQEQQVVGAPGQEKKLNTWTGHGSLHGSDIYMNMAFKMIRDLVAYCEKGPYANHIWGYHIAGGDANEWYWPGQFTQGYTGYSAPTQKLFREYVRKKYHNDVNALRKAWNNPEITFEKIEIPSLERRLISENYIFRDPQKSQDVTDVRHFMQERTLYCVTESARAVKETAGKDKVVFVYYGYPLLYAGSTLLPFSGLQTTVEVFRSPYIDMVAAPIDYGLRKCGEPGVSINGFTGTARLYHKALYREEDSPTHLTEVNLNSRTSTLRETNEIKRRSFGYSIAGPYGFWYCWMMPFHGFHQEEVMEDVAKMVKIAKQSIEMPRKSVAEVAVIFDEKDSLTYTAPECANKFLTDVTWGVYRDLHQAGAPFDVYFIDDLDNQKMPDYKMYIFLNAWSVTPATRDMIHKKLSRNNALAVWQYAPGYIDGTKFSLENMKQLTGMEFNEKRQLITIGQDVTHVQKSPLLKNFSAFPDEKLGPVFSVNDKNAEVLLRTNDLNIMAYKQMPQWRSFWTLLPLNLKLVFNLYDLAGVHVYSRRGDTLLVNESYLMVHPREKGKVTITLPDKKKVRECIEGKDFGEVSSFTEEIKEIGATKIYELR